MQILVINSGSSSIKFSLVDPDGGQHLLNGAVEKLGEGDARLKCNGGNGHSRELGQAGHAEGMAAILDILHAEYGADWTPDAVGHRVVHGYEEFTESCRIDAEVLAKLEARQYLAPLHNPVNLLGIRAALRIFPDVPQVAVFDTAFHQSIPPQAFHYAVPREWYEQHGVRRYGFHGTSHRYVTIEAARLLNRPLAETAFVSAHLGNGCSATAVLQGRSVDTSMGMTPLEGLVMGTRSGDVDPSLHSYLIERLGIDHQQMTSLLNKQSGLLGISGLSNDMRTLLEAAQHGHERAELAVNVFCYKAAKVIASLVVPLRRLDALVFTGGIGEYAAPVRARIVGHLAFLGLVLDPERNRLHGAESRGVVSRGDCPAAMVVKTDEERMIAMETAERIA